FGIGILSRGIIFTDLAIAQMAALGSAISLGYFHGEYLYLFALVFALFTGLLIAYATTRTLQLEAFIGLIYVLGASGILMVLAHSAEGMEHFKSLLANDLLFTTQELFFQTLALYSFIGLIAWKIYPKTSGLIREILFFSLLSLTVTSSVQLAGVLVVFVLLVAPALIASMQKKFPLYPFALAFGWSFSIIAILISFWADLPTGYTISAFGGLISLSCILILSPKKDAISL
ncbi:MAG: manganese transporter, partial [Sulfuricurvum sp. RIFCSPHIGHO2_12_FULL_44_8]